MTAFSVNNDDPVNGSRKGFEFDRAFESEIILGDGWNIASIPMKLPVRSTIELDEKKNVI